jgi:hypothetical protein
MAGLSWGGNFDTLAGEARQRLGRFLSDGTLDPTFDPGCDSEMATMVLEADGSLLIGGTPAVITIPPKALLRRLRNTGPGEETLQYVDHAIQWRREGTGPDFLRATFDIVMNGITTRLGEAEHVGSAWEIGNVFVAGPAHVFARGWAAGGPGRSDWFIETASAIGAPRMTVPPTSVSVSAGATAQFEVVAEGSPPLTYLWYHNGTSLRGSARLPDPTNAVLTLPEVGPDDLGTYHVVVENIHGEAISEPVRLEILPVQTPPRLTILRNEGPPLLLIEGDVGGRYLLESHDVLSSLQPWRAVTNLFLTTPSLTIRDTLLSTNRVRFYRARHLGF